MYPTPFPLLLSCSQVAERGQLASLNVTCNPQLPLTAAGQRCLSKQVLTAFAVQASALLRSQRTLQADVSLRASGSARVLIGGTVVPALTITGGEGMQAVRRQAQLGGTALCCSARHTSSLLFPSHTHRKPLLNSPAGAPASAPQNKTALVSFSAGDTPVVVEVRCPQGCSCARPRRLPCFPACLPAGPDCACFPACPFLSALPALPAC